MVFTHVLVGILLGAVFGAVFPAFTPLAVYAGILGGGLPDVDMVFTHRRTLHFPVGFSVAALVLGPFALVSPNPFSVFLFVAVLAAAIHCLMDTLGGGKEMRPWREVDDRAVYNHVTGEWINPRRIIYDGSARDLVISVTAAVGSLYLLRPRFVTTVVILLGFAILYAGLRRWIARQISEEFTTFSSYIQHHLSAVWNRLV